MVYDNYSHIESNFSINIQAYHSKKQIEEKIGNVDFGSWNQVMITDSDLDFGSYSHVIITGESVSHVDVFRSLWFSPNTNHILN